MEQAGLFFLWEVGSVRYILECDVKTCSFFPMVLDDLLVGCDRKDSIL